MDSLEVGVKYPTENELQKIANWDGTTSHEALELIEFLRSLWTFESWGFCLTGKKVLKLELHTGGWSGNESVIQVLQTNWFWMFYWQKSIRGGHYFFEIPVTKVKKKD